MLIDLKITDFVEATAAKTPTPGGGAVAAAVSSMGAALGIMAARYTEGDAAAGVAQALESLKGKLLPIVDRDAEAYQRVSKAYGLPKKTDEEKARRTEVVQEALQEAAEVPLEGMKLSLEAMRGLEPLLETHNRNLGSDYAGAAIMLDAGLLACSLNVRINAGLMKDSARRDALRTECDAMERESAERKSRILAAVRAPAKKEGKKGS